MSNVRCPILHGSSYVPKLFPPRYSLLYPYRTMRKHLALFVMGILLFLTAALASTQNRGAATAPARGTASVPATSDWPTFGGDNARTNANMAPTRITAGNVGSMVRQQVTISGPI